MRSRLATVRSILAVGGSALGVVLCIAVLLSVKSASVAKHKGRVHDEGNLRRLLMISQPA